MDSNSAQRKPRTRKERIEWFVRKFGFFTCGMLSVTDKEVKCIFEDMYSRFKDKPDYHHDEIPPLICDKCNKEIEVEHNHYCDCGKNNSSLDN